METKKILIIAGDYVEDYEIMVPFQALQMLGHEVHVVCPEKDEDDIIKTCIREITEDEQTYSERRGHDFTLNASFDEIYPEDFDALIIPGGRSPEYIRLYNEVLDIVKHFDDENKPIATIGYGPQVLITAGILEARECAGYRTIGPDIEVVGGEWIDLEKLDAHVQENLVSAPAWPAMADWLAKFLKLLES